MKTAILKAHKWFIMQPAIMILTFCSVILLFPSLGHAQKDYQALRRSGQISKENITRAQLQSMSLNQLRETMLNYDFYQITDLVNANPSQLSHRQDNLVYMSVDQFNQSEVERKIHVIQNPQHYVIVRDDSMIPKASMSRATLNSLSPEKRKAVLDSGNFIIID